MGPYHLQEVKAISSEQLERIGILRAAAWKTVFPAESQIDDWLDEFDRVARHWVITSGNELVAAARLTSHSSIAEVPYHEDYSGMFENPLPTPIGSLNRLVVAPSARGLGLSRRLDIVRIDAAKHDGCRCVVASVIARERRIRQLSELGFEVVGEGPTVDIAPWNSLRPPVVLVSFLCGAHGRSASSLSGACPHGGLAPIQKEQDADRCQYCQTNT